MGGGAGMTDEQINKSIAEACGWTKIDNLSAKGLMGKPPQKLCSFGYIPNYCNDLNAMHEAEKVLTTEQKNAFCNHLLPSEYGIWWAIHTIARQRAEAFLRTVGKWEEMPSC
jgi:hypothetical protein